MHIRIRALAGAAVLAAALLSVPAAASASPAAVARPAAARIFGPCTPLEDGAFLISGKNVYECKYVKGLGFYWVYYSANYHCSAPARAERLATARC
jgi:hypothetical protein